MGEGLVGADATLIWEEGFGVGCHLGGGDAPNLDIGCPTVEVLGVGCPSHLAIMGRGAVGGCDGDRRAEMGAYFLQDGDQIAINENGVGAIGTGKLLDTEIGG